MEHARHIGWHLACIRSTILAATAQADGVDAAASAHLDRLVRSLEQFESLWQRRLDAAAHPRAGEAGPQPTRTGRA